MKKLSLVTLMTAAGLLSSTAAHAGYDLFGDWFRVEGFGTLGAYQSNNDDVRVRPDARARAGSEGDLRFDGDTILAVQGTVNPNGALKGVIQMVSHKKIDGTTYDGNWRPLTEWAYLGWDITPEFNWKAGRVVAPLFMMSDTRNLGYSQIAVRPPQTVYQLNPITNLDGTTANWDIQAGDALMTLTGMYGKSSVANSSGAFKAGKIYGGALKANKGDWTARVGVTYFRDIEVTLTAPLQAQYTALRNNGSCANCATEVDSAIPLSGVALKMLSYGLTWEHDDYTVQAEYVNRFGNSLAAPDTKGWYVQASKRLGDWTPYVRYGELNNYDSINLLPNAGALALYNSAKVFGDATRSETAIGLRWDLAPKVALKAEYNMYKVQNPLVGTGPVINYQIGSAAATRFAGDNGRVHMMTLNLDFIF